MQWQVEPIAIPAQEEAGHVPSWAEVGGTALFYSFAVKYMFITISFMPSLWTMATFTYEYHNGLTVFDSN